MIYDLHIHTTCSDGKYSKLQLLKYFNDKKYEVISFTDHNYIESNSNINEQYFLKYGEKQDVHIIDGIEFDVEENSFLHILGYGIKNIDLINEKMKYVKDENTKISIKIIENIYNKYKISIPIEELKIKNSFISKSDITAWLIKNGYAKDYYEAGYLYTSKYSPCYEKRFSLPMNEVIDLIKKTGGISVFAHPYSINYSNENLKKMILKMIDFGLEGIEINNLDKTTKEQIVILKQFAKELNLLKSSGSDFHNEVSTPKIGLNDNESKKLIKKLR